MGLNVASKSIRQRKGEAEMAQVDWLLNCQEDITEGDAVASFVTSGDIDAVPIHLFAVSLHWPRLENNLFKNTVYVILQKQNRIYDIFNITAIIEILEKTYDDRHIGVKIAVALCCGGNDFVPKFYAISHDKLLKTFLGTERLREQMVRQDQTEKFQLNVELYQDLVKTLYCPKQKTPAQLTFEQVRTMTITARRKPKENVCGQMQLPNPQNWLPPASAVERLAEIIQFQIEYLESVGVHEADLPNFLSKRCFRQTATGEIEYNFGPESYMTANQLCATEENAKRKIDVTPQKGRRKKGQLTSTPVKR